ncbi:hypothetical protein CEUSTIGMA_g1738.t1 [Chlamydomonas eustigma]|uniref:Uncharacterized protein n=1 Tax=Chlamydomonas eustigma TaxID=1157962 RepID=A0A250WU92_9CHLO|nr:hypothetical protein CEUSTIGMA_g1738.t1 [Chlamydomonas eustigma]|eukprot:GAX74289.1 hypothetical protein CEUSTIGMA_g1738.t1 [Chlamydomonas eustigma]
MRSVSRMCPMFHKDSLACSNKYLRISIDNGTLFMNSWILNRLKGHDPGPDVPGQLLDLLETTLNFPNLLNIDLTIAYGDEISGYPLYNLIPVLTPFKADEHRSAVRIPNSGHYRSC